MAEGTRIDALPPAPSANVGYEVAAMKDGLAERLSLEQIRDLIAAYLVDAAPATLDTLNEIAAALGDDPDFAGTMTILLGEKASKANNLTDLTDPAVAAAALSSVRYVAQALSNDQKARARLNISADTLPGHIFGLILSNNTTDPSNDIDVAAGSAADGTATFRMVLGSTLVKRLDAPWAVGTNQGGLDTGSKANSTWYHVWLILRSDTGVVDVLFSTSATAPIMPTNYTHKRILGSVLTDGSGNIVAFRQTGDKFQWIAQRSVVNTTNPGTSAVTAPAGTPIGRLVEAWHSVILNNGTSGNVAMLITPLFMTDVAPNTTSNYTLMGPAPAVSAVMTNDVFVETNASAEFRYRLSASGASDVVRIANKGWIDPRGRF